MMTPNRPPADDDPDRGDDVDVRFAEIVAGWDTAPPQVDEPDGSAREEDGVTPGDEAESRRAQANHENLRNLFRQAWSEEDESAAVERDSEEHFVPPPAPPIPRPEPRRLLAWGGLVGSPLVGLLLLVSGLLHTYLSFLLFCWFVGGFAYLIATLKDDGRDGWDNGARV
jgi:hypothetical protein